MEGLPPSHPDLRSPLALSALGLLLTSCGGDSPSPTDPPEPPLPELERSGDAQQGLAGSALADSLEVRVLNDDDPVVGLTITWSAASGGGSASPVSTVTDAEGRARSQLVLGGNPGQNTVEAVGAGFQTATFIATGQAPASTVLDPAGNHELGVGPTNYERSLVPEGTIRGVLIYVDFDEAPATETTEEIYERLVPNSIDWFRRGLLRTRRPRNHPGPLPGRARPHCSGRRRRGTLPSPRAGTGRPALRLVLNTLSCFLEDGGAITVR